MIAQATGGAMSITGTTGPAAAEARPDDRRYRYRTPCRVRYSGRLHPALENRPRQKVEVSMQDAIVNFVRVPMMGTHISHKPTKRTGDKGAGMGVYGVYKCAPGGDDDYAFIFTSNEDMWQLLCQAMGQPELAQGRALRHQQATVEEWRRTDRDSHRVDHQAYQVRSDEDPGRTRSPVWRGTGHPGVAQ